MPISLKVLLDGQLKFFQQQGFEVMALSADGPEVAGLVKEGIPHTVIHMTRKITPWNDLISLLKLIKVMKEFRPQIVHTHTPKAGLLGMIAGWICQVPVRMHTIAGLPLMESTGVKRLLLSVTERITYMFAHYLYPNSMVLSDFIKTEFNIPSHKLRMIGKGSSNGIDTVRFKRTPEIVEKAQMLRQQYGIRSNDVVFSFVGRIVKDKGISELIKAYLAIVEHHPANKVFLMLVGSFEQDLNPLSKEDYAFLKEHPQVIIPGFQADVRPWIVASDIFLFPSYREGFPNVVMQAGCLEVPCIASDISGCREIVEHGVSGLLVRPKDADGLTKAIMSLINDKQSRMAYARNARTFLVANFDQGHFWSMLLDEYRNALHDRIK